MIIESKAYGQIEIDSKQVMRFPHGLFGFENLTEWALLDSGQPPFYWLQSLEAVEICFVLIDPKYFRPEYVAEISSDDEHILQLSDIRDLLTFAIVTIPAEQEKMTANLQGPVLINKISKIGKQGIQSSPTWQIKHLIMEELATQKVV